MLIYFTNDNLATAFASSVTCKETGSHNKIACSVFYMYFFITVSCLPIANLQVWRVLSEFCKLLSIPGNITWNCSALIASNDTGNEVHSHLSLGSWVESEVEASSLLACCRSLKRYFQPQASAFLSLISAFVPNNSTELLDGSITYQQTNKKNRRLLTMDKDSKSTLQKPKSKNAGKVDVNLHTENVSI